MKALAICIVAVLSLAATAHRLPPQLATKLRAAGHASAADWRRRLDPEAYMWFCGTAPEHLLEMARVKATGRTNGSHVLGRQAFPGRDILDHK